MRRQSVLTIALLVFVLPSFVLQANAQPGTADRIAKVEFTSTPAPATPEEMSVAYTRSDAVVTYADGRRKVFPSRTTCSTAPATSSAAGRPR